LTKRLTQKQKDKIIRSFFEGKTLDELSKEFDCTKLTISRNLKKHLGEKSYKEIINTNKMVKNNNYTEQNLTNNKINRISNINQKKEHFYNDKFSEYDSNEELTKTNQFLELPPLGYEIDNLQQKDLSSTPINEIEFPKVVYMVVDKRIELETKLLKDFPEWQFLSQDDLNRKTFEIYYDLHIAKRDCGKEQKVIKVPNPEVFKIAAPILVARGITRIVSSQTLIAL